MLATVMLVLLSVVVGFILRSYAGLPRYFFVHWARIHNREGLFTPFTTLFENENKHEILCVCLHAFVNWRFVGHVCAFYDPRDGRRETRGSVLQAYGSNSHRRYGIRELPTRFEDRGLRRGRRNSAGL